MEHNTHTEKVSHQLFRNKGNPVDNGVGSYFG